MKRLWITGYRSYELGIFKDDDPKLKVIKALLKEEMKRKIEDGYEWFITGAQMGIEQWSVQVANELKKEYPNEFKVAVMLPFTEMEKRWNETNQMRYNQTIRLADYSAPVSNHPYESPQQLRNYQEFMLEHTEQAFLIYDIDNQGKTKYDYQAINTYMQNNDYDYQIVNFDDLQEFAIEYQENHRNDLQS